jgi:hypothetical protein
MAHLKTPLIALLFTLVMLTQYVPLQHENEPIMFLEETHEIQFPASARSSGDVFLLGGGSSNAHEFAQLIAPTLSGYVVAGDYSQSLSLGSHSLNPTTTNSPYQQKSEYYLAGVTETGTWDWVVGADHSNGVSFIEDLDSSMGSTFVTGYFAGSIGYSTGQALATSSVDGYLVRYDPMGNMMWASQTTSTQNGTNDYAIPQVVKVDQFGDVYLAGVFKGETDFGGISYNVSNEEVFIAKYGGMQGNLLWAEVGGGIGGQTVTDLAFDSTGLIHLSGYTQNNVVFGSNSYTTQGTLDSFIVKIDVNGNFQGTTGYGAPNSVVAILQMEFDSQGDAIYGGQYTGTFAKSTWSISANQGYADLFVFKASSNPQNDWAVTGGTNLNDSVTAMTITSNDDIVFGTTISGSFITPTKSISIGGNSDALIAGITRMGVWDWLDVSDSAGYEVGFDIAKNSSDVVVIAGAYGNNAVTKGSTTIQPIGGYDLMLWAFDPANKKDADGDGVPDYLDNCPNISNPSQANTDMDSQGDDCDSDDDNDGLTDNAPDNCPRNGQFNWTSTQDFLNPSNSTDFDKDGCHDDLEDNDNDNDNVEDANDNCPYSSYQPPRPTWVSNSTTDVDGDGCRDSDEDENDDGDGFDDVDDDCPTTPGDSTLGLTGCIDTDGDGWADTFDDCPNDAGNSSLGGKNACPDQDGDGWADSDDAFTLDPTQWADTDGDGYGDNAEGTTPDDCINAAGTSTIDRLGCVDTDGDGYSDEDEMWSTENGADAFPEDDTQWSDFDEDGFGDNYGNQSWTDRNPSWPGEYHPEVMAHQQDSCPTFAGTSWKNNMYGCPDADGDGWYDKQDAFINDPTQHLDTDGDGYGDNQSGFQPDACVNTPGTSTLDRFGCPDTDGDGYSDPDPDSNYLPANGADAFYEDPTQWADRDGDGFGDNPEGLNADDCPDIRDTSSIDRIGCEDTDGDGYSDPDANWGIENGADACTFIPGNSTQDRIGCLDTDGDGYSDPSEGYGYAEGADAYPEDPTRWIYEAAKPDGTSSNTTMFIVAGLILLVIGGIGAFLFMRQNEADLTQDKELIGLGASAPQSAVAMPDMYAQPVATQPAVAMPDMYAQPVATQPAVAMPDMYAQPAAQPVAQPVVNPDALNYYNGLISQGYPQEYALMYTQQYYPGFQI